MYWHDFSLIRAVKRATPIKTLLLLSVFTLFFGCDEENLIAQKEEWILTEYEAQTTSFCFAFDDDGNPLEGDQAHPIFNTLLGLDDQEFHNTTLSLDVSGSYSIYKNGHLAMEGPMEIDHQAFRLKYAHHNMEMKILNKTTDSLIMQTKGYEREITEVTMIFYRKNN